MKFSYTDAYTTQRWNRTQLQGSRSLEKERDRDESNAATGMHYGVLFLLPLSLILYVILKRTSPELEGPRRLFPPIRSEDLEWAAPNLCQWQAPGFSHGWLKLSSSHVEG